MAEYTPGVNYGDGSASQAVFGLYTDEALTSLKFEAYDNDQTFPQTDTALTVANTILDGTTKNGDKSMVCLADVTDAAPVKCWKPYAATGGAANPNRLKGTTSYVERTDSSQEAEEVALFNMCIEIPSDVETTDPIGFDLLGRYQHTGAAPTPAWKIYHLSTTTWYTLTVDVDGIKHCKTGSGAGDMFANIPAADFVQGEISQCSGLDDATSSGTYTGSTVGFFEVIIDGTGTPDTFKWRKNEGSWTETVAITGSAQQLGSDGVYITFAATTGHTADDKWTITAGAEDTKEAWSTQ